jgi:hypothetical protein
MWRCHHCAEGVEDDFELCWNCGMPRSGGEPAWPVPSPDAVAAREYDADLGASTGKIGVLAAIELGFRTVVAHPIILLAALPTLAWEAIATITHVRAAGFFTPHEPLGWQAGWQERLTHLPSLLLVDPVAEGLAVLLAYGAIRRAVSLPGALSMLGWRLPRLLFITALFGGVSVVAVAVAEQFLFGTVLVVGVLVVGVRFTFCDLAILLDGADVASALRQSWDVTRGNWWRTVALGLVLVPLGLLVRVLPVPVAVLMRALSGPFAQAVLVCAYLQRTGELTHVRRAANALEPISVPGF